MIKCQLKKLTTYCKMPIRENIENIKKDLPKNIKLIAATKTRSIEEIKQAIEAGITIIGENYIQEAEEKLKGEFQHT
ncbi:unnamed protein product, partial [marine sediment metagenome]